MQINVKIDNTALILRLDKGPRRLAYAVVNAINNTALRIRQAEEAHFRKELEIRNEQFWFGSAHAAAHIWNASVGAGRAFAEVSLEAPATSGLLGSRFVAPLLETGGVRRPFSPRAHHVAVPITGSPARPSWSSPVPRELRFGGQGMGLVKWKYRGEKFRKYRRPGTRKGKSGVQHTREEQSLFGSEGRIERLPGYEKGAQWKGRHGTYMILDPDGGGRVFKRVGPGKRDSRVIWKFREPMRLRRRLRWMLVARTVANKWFKEEMERQVVDALAHTGGRGL